VLTLAHMILRQLRGFDQRKITINGYAILDREDTSYLCSIYHCGKHREDTQRHSDPTSIPTAMR
jgi:hypothetical protein